MFLLKVVPGHVPTKRRIRTPVAKKVNSSCVSPYIAPSVSPSIPTKKTKYVDPIDVLHVVKKPHTITSLYVDPIKIHDGSHNVNTSDCDPMVSNVVGSSETSENPTSESRSLENPRSVNMVNHLYVVENSVGACVSKLSSKNVMTNLVSDEPNIVNIPIYESLKETVTLSNVASDVVTSLAQPDAHVVTTQNNLHIESESESASDSKSSQQKMVTNDGEEQKIKMKVKNLYLKIADQIVKIKT